MAGVSHVFPEALLKTSIDGLDASSLSPAMACDDRGVAA